MSHLVTINGSISGVADIFTHTIAVSGTGTLQQIAEGVRDEFEESFTDATLGLTGDTASTVTYTHVTAAEVLDPGPADPQLSAAFRADFATPFSGSGSALPPQCAVAITLRAGNRPNGTPIRGRFYLPVPSSGQISTSNGLLTTATQTEYLDWASNFLDRLISVGLAPLVWSRTLGIFSAVSQVLVGDRVDTIRSRRNAGLEEYVTAAVPSS